MNATLPHGLITIGHTDRRNDNSTHYADVLFERSNILHQFWRVHAIQHRVSKDPSAFRCQNLFWRTWGDSRLSSKITTSTLTSLWSSCQQPVDAASLRKEVKVSHHRDWRNIRKNSLDLSNTPTGRESEADVVPASSSLLASVQSGSQSPVSQRLKARQTSGDDEETGPGVTTDSARRHSRSSRPGLTRAGSSSSRIQTGASSGRMKTRPPLNWRKSSQGPPQGKTTKLGKTGPRSPVLPSKGLQEAEVSPSATTSTFELPSASSWEDEPTMDSNRLSTFASHVSTQSDLVEPNFRKQFVERIASSSNISNMNRIKKTGSVVRFADEVPTDLRDRKERESGSTQGSDRIPVLSHRDSVASVASVAVIDEDEVVSPQLPRTKSQLSMLIEESRSKNKREHAEPEIPAENIGLSSRRKRDPTDAEKVLAMAHGEGVTRFGGRQIRKGFKFSDGSEMRYSSPSPPPLF